MIKIVIIALVVLGAFLGCNWLSLAPLYTGLVMAAASLITFNRLS